MGVKALYTDTRKKTIHELIVSKNIDLIKGIIHDRNEYREYGSTWQAVNLDEYVAQLKITGDQYNMENNQRKISFFKDNKEYAIVTAIGGKYFRVQEIKSDGTGGKYVDLNLKEPYIPGRFQGKDRSIEWRRRTHFRMTHKKGTV